MKLEESSYKIYLLLNIISFNNIIKAKKLIFLIETAKAEELESVALRSNGVLDNL